MSDHMLGEGTTALTYYQAQVKTYADYYPFGLEMEGRTASSPNYRYGFNGKEKDASGEFSAGQTHYDYGFRIYNPVWAKFLSVDPIGGQFPWNSPFSFAEGSPIANIDLDGLERVYFWEDNNGNPHLWKVENFDLIKYTEPGGLSGYNQPMAIKVRNPHVEFINITEISRLKQAEEEQKRRIRQGLAKLEAEKNKIQNPFWSMAQLTPGPAIAEGIAAYQNGDHTTMMWSGLTLLIPGAWDDEVSTIIRQGRNAGGAFIAKGFKPQTLAKYQSKAWFRYQGKINGIGGGVEYRYNDVDFDGFLNGRLLEAKGNYDWVLRSGKVDPNAVFESMFKQLQSQIRAANGLPLDWHFMEEATREGFTKFLQGQKFDIPSNVTINHTPR